MPKSSKRAKLINSKVDRDKLHNLDEAIDLIKSVKATKFDETVEL
ncbi:MAG: 50S ribosomal protein L1, partial [bacterium]